jgi:hypothetical protein
MRYNHCALKTRNDSFKTAVNPGRWQALDIFHFTRFLDTITSLNVLLVGIYCVTIVRFNSVLVDNNVEPYLSTVCYIINSITKLCETAICMTTPCQHAYPCVMPPRLTYAMSRGAVCILHLPLHCMTPTPNLVLLIWQQLSVVSLKWAASNEFKSVRREFVGFKAELEEWDNGPNSFFTLPCYSFSAATAAVTAPIAFPLHRVVKWIRPNKRFYGNAWNFFFVCKLGDFISETVQICNVRFGNKLMSIVPPDSSSCLSSSYLLRRYEFFVARGGGSGRHE